MKTDTRVITSKTIRNALAKASNFQCAICGSNLDQSFHADHIVPWKLTRVTNPHAMQALCKNCNLKKGSKLLKKSGGQSC